MSLTAPSSSTLKEIEPLNFLPITVDNFLESSEFCSLSEEFFHLPLQLCNWSDSEDIFLFFGVRNSEKPLHLNCFASSIALRVKKYLKRKLFLKRIHINGQVYGQDGRFHRDSEEPNVISVLIFTNPFWVPSWGGAFTYIQEPSPEVFSVAYVPNRAVIFPANILHCGQAPLRCTDKMRTSMVFCF
jgi:hypothetical protein